MSKPLERTGRIHLIHDLKTISESFSVKTFILDLSLNEDEKYDNYLQFELSNEYIALLENVKNGDNVKVKFYLQGRLYGDSNDKCFNKLKAIDIVLLNQNKQKDDRVFAQFDDTRKIEQDALGVNDDLPF